MPKMRKSKCLFSKSGSVFSLDEKTDTVKTIGHVFCDIDAWDENTSCTPDGCYYYTRTKNKEKTNGD